MWDEMNIAAMLWFAVTGLLIVGEVFTTTFYLLALALGALAAGALAYQGSPLEHQLAAAFVLSGVAVLIIWLNRRPAMDVDVPALAQDDVDIGQSVVLVNHSPLLVHYRGADWQARLVTHHQLDTGNTPVSLVIVAKEGNVLMVKPVAGV